MDDKKHGRDESEDLPLNKAATPDHKVQDYSFQERCKKDGKEVFVINDPIHGHIELHSLLIKIIDTPQFQRLRYIKQLGGGYYVFPGASHNRFEHSIGVSHLAGEFAESLRERQPKLNITDQDVLCVKIAGLCHDLGHGPFSHLFDGMFIPEVLRKEGDSALGKDKWKHEKGSILMLEHLIDSNNLKEEFKKNGLDEGDLMFIKELIDGPQQETDDESEWPYMGRDADKGFLYEIVANKRTGIDVDKFDYFARDSHGLGILINFDHKRYIKFARAIKVGNKWQICSRDKEVTNLYDLFYIRNRLHRTAYKHKTTQIVEIMITEALVKADKHVFIPGKDSEEVRMSQAICDPHAYTNLNDSIIFSIMQSTKEELAESKKILEQLQRRQLYKCVVQAQFDSEEKEEKIKEGILKLREQNTSCSEDLADCLIVKVVKFHYGMGSKNPIDEMRFYSKENPDEAKPIHKHLVSQMLPETFQEKLIFIFCKSMEMSTLEAVYSCFEAWCKEKQKYLTPSKKNSALYDPIKVFSTTKKVTQDEEEDADGSRRGESVKRSLFKS